MTLDQQCSSTDTQPTYSMTWQGPKGSPPSPQGDLFTEVEKTLTYTGGDMFSDGTLTSEELQEIKILGL